MDFKHSPKLKFLYSYGGKILPCSTNGVLRYVNGYTRVLSIDPFISFSDLMVKIVEFCGSSITLKCSLPNGDLETLITIANDEDLAIIIEEYKRASSSMENQLKIQALLSPPRSLKKVSPPPSLWCPAISNSVNAAIELNLFKIIGEGSPIGKYALDILKETQMMACRPSKFPMKQNCRLSSTKSDLHPIPGRY